MFGTEGGEKLPEKVKIKEEIDALIFTLNSKNFF
jgi:hypothetical protein